MWQPAHHQRRQGRHRRLDDAIREGAADPDPISAQRATASESDPAERGIVSDIEYSEIARRMFLHVGETRALRMTHGSRTPGLLQAKAIIGTAVPLRISATRSKRPAASARPSRTGSPGVRLGRLRGRYRRYRRLSPMRFTT